MTGGRYAAPVPAARARSITLRVPLYGARVRAFAAETARAARDAAARRPGLAELPSLAGDDDGALLRTPAGDLVLALPLDASPGLLAHEALHAAVAVLERAGVPVSAKADEAIAYLLAWIVDELSKWLARCRAAR